MVLPGQQVPPRGRLLADPAAADGSVPSFGPTFTGLLGERGSSVWDGLGRLRSCWAIDPVARVAAC